MQCIQRLISPRKYRTDWTCIPTIPSNHEQDESTACQHWWICFLFYSNWPTHSWHIAGQTHDPECQKVSYSSYQVQRMIDQSSMIFKRGWNWLLNINVVIGTEAANDFMTPWPPSIQLIFLLFHFKAIEPFCSWPTFNLNAQIEAKLSIFQSKWPWNLTDDLEHEPY